MIGFRMKMIAAGYKNLNDAHTLRRDPFFNMAEGALPSDGDLASQATLCQLENGAGPSEFLSMGYAFVDLNCACFKVPPAPI